MKASGTKIRVREVRANQYVWKCKDPRCPKSKLDGAIKGTVYNWVLLLAAQHLQGAANRKEKIARRKKIEGVLLES